MATGYGESLLRSGRAIDTRCWEQAHGGQRLQPPGATKPNRSEVAGGRKPAETATESASRWVEAYKGMCVWMMAAESRSRQRQGG